MKLEDRVKFIEKVIMSCKTPDQAKVALNWSKRAHIPDYSFLGRYQTLLDFEKRVKQMQEYFKRRDGDLL